MRKQIRFAGYGGQGLVLSGIILGKAAAILENRYASQVQSYGVEARGGASRADVIIDDESIDCPEVHVPDVMIVFSQEAATKYGNNIAPDGVIFYDSELVKWPDEKPNVKMVPVPATKIARDDLKAVISANMVMLGAVVEATGVIKIESLLKSMEESTPEKAKTTNHRAVQCGMEAVRGIYQ